MRTRLLLATILLSCACLPMKAESGDAAAVIQFCGPPTGEHQDISQVTGKLQRDLIYGKMILHFQPRENGWTFLSGWLDHLPQTENMVENRMPCFREAIASARAAAPKDVSANEDPTIRAQTTVPSEDTSTFGIPHLRVILILAVLVAFLFLLPSRRKAPARMTEIEAMRQRRRPSVEHVIHNGPRSKPGV